MTGMGITCTYEICRTQFASLQDGGVDKVHGEQMRKRMRLRRLTFSDTGTLQNNCPRDDHVAKSLGLPTDHIDTTTRLLARLLEATTTNLYVVMVMATAR